jgi:hypothetical protein
MKHMRQPNGKIKPVLPIYEQLHLDMGWVTLEGHELEDHLAEEAYHAALRTRERQRLGAVQSRPLNKGEKEAIEIWEKRLAEKAGAAASGAAPDAKQPELVSA